MLKLPAPRPNTVTEVFLAFLSLGLTSFGGPVAHLGYFRRAFVEERRWLSEAEYADLVALCQFLPGPASSQVGIALGKMRAGTLGAIAAFIGFTLPSVLLLLAFAWGAARFDGPILTGLVHGLKLAALAVVAQAVWAMARSLAPDLPRRTALVLATVATLAFSSPVVPIGVLAIAAAIGWARASGPRTHLPALPPHSVWPLLVFAVLLVGLPLLALSGNPFVSIFEKFYRTGSLVFGGGHVVLPLLETELVAPGLVPRDLFLAGYGAAQAVPGPLFSFAAYAGAILTNPPNGLFGALWALLAIYLPSFLLVFGTLPLWQSLRADTRLRAGLDLANGAVVGLLLATLYDPVFTSAVFGPIDLIIAIGALIALFRRVPPPLVVLVAAALGVVRVLIGF